MQWLAGVVSAVVVFFSGALGLAQVRTPAATNLSSDQALSQQASSTLEGISTSSVSVESTSEATSPIQIPLTVPASPNNATICNGVYYSSCSSGAAPICPKTGAAYCPSALPVQQSTPQTPPTETTGTSQSSIQTASECASLGLQKEDSDRVNLLGTEIIVKDAYGYSSSLNTCIYAVQYEAPSLNTDTGEYFDLNKGTILTLPQAGTWQISWLSLPASDFVYDGYVYNCNNLPIFFSSGNQTGQSAWSKVITGASCGTVWVNAAGVDVSQSLGTEASHMSNDSSNVAGFWNEYFTLAPQL